MTKSVELELFTLFKMTPDLVCIAGKDGYFRKVNPAVINKLEYTEKELFASPIASFIYPEDKAITQKTRQELLNGKTLLNFRNRYVSKSGKLVWLEWTSIYFPDHEVVFAIAKDVTQRKEIEKQVEEKYKKYKGVATYFKNKIEDDKKHIAYGLHEELAQLVAAMKLYIEWIANNETQMSSTSKDMIERALAVSKLLITSIQKISFSVSPNMLDEFGFTATMEWLCKEFSVLNEIPCSFHGNYKEENLSHEMKIDFFRICQETLSNVITLSRSTDIKIKIDELNESMQICITDEGGFEMNTKNESAGLINMREYVNSINGQLTLQNAPGKGSAICITIEKE